MANLRSSRFQLRVNNPDAISAVDALEPVQSQYAASPRIVGLLVRKAALLDIGKDLLAWYDKMFNPKTAEGTGLDIWGRIVGIGRSLWVESFDYFGFAGQNLQNFDRAPFWLKTLASGQTDLSDEAFRLLIFCKAAANISGSTMEDLNRLLEALLGAAHGPGSCCVIESGTMSVRMVFKFYLTDYEQAILRQYGLPGRPAGVELEWFQFSPGELFGFSGQELQNFDNGIFTPFEYTVPD